MKTQRINLKPVRWAFFLFLFAFFGCGRGGGASGHRGAAPSVEPVAEKPAAAAAGPVTYAVYMDNSASMDGYLSGAGTDFKNDVHTLLKDLETQGIADTIDLGYVNDRICLYRNHATAAEANAFIRTLNHDSLKLDGCGRSDSYMDAMLQRVIGSDPDAVHVLISDYIFSIGRGNSSELLKQQGDNVEMVLSGELRKRDFSTMILKFNSGFDGTYYVESRGGGNGSAVTVHGVRRPYYMMFFGPGARLRKLEEFYKSSNFRTFSGFEDVCFFGRGGSTPAAKLIRTNRMGDFEIAQPATQLVIEKAKADSGLFQFAVAVNLDALKRNEAYLTNPANYELPANYKIVSIMRNNDPTDQAMRGFSHVFLIRTTDLKGVQDVYVRLKSRIPEWVYTGSTTDDAKPTDLMQQKQTFGFSYLVEGIARAYGDKDKNTDVFGLNIQVAEGSNVASRGGDGGADGLAGGSGSRGGFPWVLVVIAGVVIGLVVWIKNKR